MPLKPRPVRKYNAQELFHYALNLLGARALSSSEVRTKLTRKAANPDDVEPTLAKLREYGYLDDEKFAEGYATARRDSGSFGKLRVVRDLRTRRVAGTVARKAVNEAYSDTDETALIEQWLERKYRNKQLTELLQEEKNLASAFRKLCYAGFSAGASIRVLKRYAERAGELEYEEPPGADQA